MADEWIKVGQTFSVTLDTTPLITLGDYTGKVIYYKRPDGKSGTITPDSTTGSTMVGTVSVALNPVSVTGGDPRWKDGYAGAWEFYPYCLGSGAIAYRGKEDIVQVHPQWRNP